jgi:hypothetical protein
MALQLLKKLTLLFSLCLVSALSNAQFNNDFRFYYPEFESQRSNQLILHVSNFNFLKDNEYENPFTWGHTLIGYGIQPSLMYYANDRLRLRAGLFLQQYSGLDYYSKVRPILSAHLRMTPSLDIIMGALRGHLHHQIIEPLFDPERQYTRPVENGLQILINRPWLWTDMWVDWEQFIQEGDLFPEWFTVGMSAYPKLLDDSMQPWQIYIPFNALAVHRGGEVSDYPELVQTSMNFAAGLKINRKWEGMLKNTQVFGYAMNYRNLNDANSRGVNSGYAWYIGAGADTKQLSLMVGYFYGHDFVALRGGGIFQSVSPIRDDVYVPTRKLVTMKAGYNRIFLKEIKFSFLFEGYYDTDDSRLDFAPSVQLIFSPSFFITEAEFF